MAPLLLATCDLDDAIAELHACIAADAAGEVVEPSRLVNIRNRSADAFASGGIPWDAQELGRAINEADVQQVQPRLRAALAALLDQRPRLLRAQTGERSGVDRSVLAVAHAISQQVRDELERQSPGAQPPARCWWVLHLLVRFMEQHRRNGRRWFDAATHEKPFHRRLKEFLQAIDQDVESEVSEGAGRVDLMLLDAPVELKATELGHDPRQATQAFWAQAANYAVEKHSAVAILIMLDQTDRTAEGYPAHLADNIRVGYLESTGGLRPHGGTVVVTIRVPAVVTSPSALKTYSNCGPVPVRAP